MTRPAELPDFAPGLERVLADCADEASYPLKVRHGAIPDFVRGRYYLNGPSRFARGGGRYRHWLDGDGMVTALRFDDDGVQMTSRFVRTHKLVAEEEAGEPLYRTFGTGFVRDRLKHRMGIESPANVSVYPCGENLLAFGEQGLPWALDPVTLETRGEHDFGRALNGVSPFAAHPSWDETTGEMFNFGVSFSLQRPTLHFYRFTADGALLSRSRIPLAFPSSLHDFALAPRHAVFYLAPYVLDVVALIQDGMTIQEALRWEPARGSRLLILDRETGAELARPEVRPGYCLHTINAFEEDGHLIVDLLELERPIYDQYQVVPDLFTDVAPGRPVRYILDGKRFEVLERQSLDYDRAPDFATIDPRRARSTYRDFWLLGMSACGTEGRKFFDQLVHSRWHADQPVGRYQTPAGCYLGGEPVVIPDPARPDCGLILCQRFDANAGTSSFVLFDNQNVAAGPIAELPLRSTLLPGFHACWEPAT